MAERPLRILQVNRVDDMGGDVSVAWGLHKAYLERGLQSWMAVGQKHLDDPNVFLVPNDDSRNQWARIWLTIGNVLSPLVGKVRGFRRLRNWLRMTGQPRRWHDILRGYEDFAFPGTWKLLDITSQRPEIVHYHNLHGGYFDLRALPWLSHQAPMLMTSHDAWLLSGHCAQSLDCERWKIGCGECPYLSIYPAVRRDATAYNWKRKQDIYNKSLIYLACPSQWLLDKAKISILEPSLQMSRVIPNGIDLSIYKPADQKTARAALGLPQDARIILTVGNLIKINPWKDYATMEAAVRLSGMVNDERLIFLILGHEAPTQLQNNLEIRFIPIQRDSMQVALYYQSADIYIHAAKADTFPTTVLEALACGCPVIATRVGGIPEQVIDGETGFLVRPADPIALNNYLKLLFDDEKLRVRLAHNAAEYAGRNFSMDKMVDSYLAYYNEILLDWAGRTKTSPDFASDSQRLRNHHQ